MRPIRLLLPLLLLPLLGVRAADIELGEPFPIAAGKYQIRPVKGMSFQPPNTPGVEAFFMGLIGKHGPATLVVLFLPDVGGLPTTEEEAIVHTREVAEGLEDPRTLGVRLLDGGGIEMEFVITQFMGGGSRRMYMLQRQYQADGGLFSLTAVCLRDSAEEVGPALIASLDSFDRAGPAAPMKRGSILPEPADADDRIRLASALIPQGRLQEAHDLAAGVTDEDPFLARVGSHRIRFATLLSMGRFAEARKLVSSYMRLWRSDDRPFSDHYAWMLRQGMKDFMKRLHEVERAKLGDGARAALGQVALAAWAGPPDMVPPRITRKQDRFFAALRRIGEAQGAAMNMAWKAVEPSLDAAASEVEAFLKKTAGAGTVLGPREADFQWLQTSLFLPLVSALEDGDRKRYREVLDLFRKVRGPSPGIYDPISDLKKSVGKISRGKGAGVRDYAYRIWSTTGTGLYLRTRALLEKEGLDGLLARGAAMIESSR